MTRPIRRTRLSLPAPFTRPPLLVLSAMLLLAALLLPARAPAIDMVDPALTWHTLTTAHFEITYHEGEELLARRAAERAELIHDVLSRELDWSPKHKVQIVIVDRQDTANGYATPLPFNHIVLYPAAPEDSSSLDLYEDWLTMLIAHEYTHILHMDMIAGLPKLARTLMGTIIAPNALMPRWMLEGFATLEETRQTLGGRGRASYTDMMVRMAALSGRFPRLDQADGYGALWPYGQLPYLFGVRFQQWVANRYGVDAWVRFYKRNARSPIPWLFPHHAKKEFGKSLDRLWREWKAEMVLEARREEQARRARGLTEAALISSGLGAVNGVRVSPAGARVFLAESFPDREAEIAAVDLDGQNRRVLDRGRAPQSFTFSPDGQRVYFSTPAIHTLYDTFDDLYVIDLETGKLKRLTRGERARDPELSPDGGRLLFVGNRAGQTNLKYTQIDGRVLPLTHATDFTQYASPRFSPDGQRFVASIWAPGGYRDLYLFSREGEMLRRLTVDPARDRDPAFSPDGRYVVFSSDRDGIFNLYALELEASRLFQVTNVLGGAFQPSITPDGKTLIFQGYHGRGFDAYRMPFAPSSWLEVPLPGQGETPLQAENRGQPPSEGGAGTSAMTLPAEAGKPLPALSWPATRARLEGPSTVAPPRRYSPLDTLQPRFYAPLGYLTEAGAVGGLYTFGGDVLSKHAYYAALTWRTDNHYLGYSFTYTNQQLKTPLILSLSSTSVSYGNLPQVRGVTVPSPVFYGLERSLYTYYEVRTRFSLGVQLPFSRYSQTVFRYGYECREPLEPLPGEQNARVWDGNPLSCAAPLADVPLGFHPAYVPARGRLTGLSLAYRWSKGERYRRSISVERGSYFDASLQWQSRYLGGDYERGVLTLDGRRYLSLPWPGNGWWRGHVLAVRGAMGLAVGNDLPQPSFRLGGSFGESPAVVFPDEYYPLRGYPAGASNGEAFVLGSLEYRFPIVRLDRGLSTWPVFAQGLSGALFVDGGKADELPSIDRILDKNGWQSWGQGFKLGVGGELKADVVVSYGLSMTVRTGVGIGLTGNGYPAGDLRGWYLQIGSHF